jgi:hypothetical protein
VSTPAAVLVIVGLLIFGAYLLVATNVHVEFVLNPIDCLNGGGIWAKGWCYK